MTKSVIDGDVNHLGKNCNRLQRSAGKTREEQYRIGETSRHDINRGRETSVTRDYFKNLSVIRKGLKGRNEGEMLDLILDAVCEGRKRGQSDNKDKKKVLDSFIDFAKDNEVFADPALIGRLRQRYEDDVRQNSGNPNARGTDVGTITAAEQFIEPYAKQALGNQSVSEEFIVQVKGNGATKSRQATRPDGTPQGLPEDGSTVVYTDLDTGNQESFVFRHSRLLKGKLFYSLNDTFTKKPKGSGKGGNKKVARYDRKLRLQYRRGMLRLTAKKSGVEVANDSNWVVARVVYSPDAGNAPTPYES
ncbi:hypothetical protein THAOC_07932 [Thalassiosira oceanica]|uniref:Uncharacterized protein n=1 Tax=Thalassiosira oceanica TaxID=159749 RepID=K0T0L0_THAOC|nr:hypothetical protein THAOC_07932 [Thalassiosira oceanica]|eukprot:EJK70689.1 hypothetical protein THAOC_07932 [Thalassiosira oceanica]